MMDLSESDRAKVEAAVAAAERRTGAQFALVVAHASDEYAPYPMLWSAVIALIVGDAVALIRPELGTWWIVALQAALFIVADVILHLRPLRYHLVPNRVRKAHATRLARLEFAARVQNRTASDVGLLLFVSAAERHVEILVDRGIAARIDQKLWEKIVADFVATVGAGQIAAALINAVEACTALLERHFPPQPGTEATIPGTVTEV
jgi:putative membrane protein